MSQLTEIMKQRKSVRRYDSNFTISQEEITELLNEASSAPSSSNIQPWRFIIIQNKDIQKELRTIGYNQAQIEEASAIIAVLGDIEAYKNAEQIYQANVEQGYMPQEVANNMIANTTKMYSSLPKEYLMPIVAYDAGAFAMQFMLLAKERGYDTVTMGGFEKDKFAQRFELPGNLFPITLIALGKAVEPARGTSRLPIETLTTYYS